MRVKAIKTTKIKACDSIFDILDKFLPKKIEEKSIIAISSKIISLCENRVIEISEKINKYDLIKQEAEAILETKTNPYNIYLTIIHGLLIPTAGIDESNGDGSYILYPKDPTKSASIIWEYLKNRDNLKEIGIIITDSHTSPLRRGVTGITIGWCGFEPIYNYVGKPDIYGRKLAVTSVNNLDALAATSVFVMGEGNEQTPIAIITDLERIEFTNHPPTNEDKNLITISIDEDIYAPLLQNGNWRFKAIR